MGIQPSRKFVPRTIRRNRKCSRSPYPADYFLLESTSTMRVCQPGPLAFQRASTSCGRRRDIAVRGEVLFGRPRGRNSLLAIAFPKISGSTSRAGRARRKSSAVHSGLSGSVRTRFVFRLVGIPAYLSFVRLSKARASEMPCTATLRAFFVGSNEKSTYLSYIR